LLVKLDSYRGWAMLGNREKSADRKGQGGVWRERVLGGNGKREVWQCGGSEEMIRGNVVGTPDLVTGKVLGQEGWGAEGSMD
jgi:hypothetical protein